MIWLLFILIDMLFSAVVLQTCSSSAAAVQQQCSGSERMQKAKNPLSQPIDLILQGGLYEGCALTTS